MYSIKELMQDFTMYHSNFQRDNFITAKSGGTPYGQYKQALREMHSRINSMRETYYQIETTKLDIEELQLEVSELKCDIENSYTVIEIKRKELEINNKKMNLYTHEKTLHDSKEEFTRFYQHAIYWKEKLGALTTERKEKLEQEFWIHRIKEMSAMDFMTQKSLSRPTLDLLYSIPKDMMLELQKEFEQVTLPDGSLAPKIVSWFFNERQELKIPVSELPKVTFNENEIKDISLLNFEE